MHAARFKLNLAYFTEKSSVEMPPTRHFIHINQSMALSASCAGPGHTRTQSHAALYKVINEVIHSGMVVQTWVCRECEVMDDTWYVHMHLYT